MVSDRDDVQRHDFRVRTELSPDYFDLYESEQAELYCRLSHNSSEVESPRGSYCFRRENIRYKNQANKDPCLPCFVLL